MSNPDPSRAALADELLSCPFCGGKPAFERHGTSRQSCIIACQDCGCRVETGETWNEGIVWNTRASLPPTLNSGAVTREELLDRNWKDAKEFCEGAFGPFVTDVSQYTKIVSELMEHATDRALTGRGEIRTALQIALEQATEAFDYAKSKDDHALCEMRYSTIEDALAALSHPKTGDGK